MRDVGAEAYASYRKMCERLGHPVMTREAYEKATQAVYSTPVNVDAVLMNNNRRKDRYDATRPVKKGRRSKTHAL